MRKEIQEKMDVIHREYPAVAAELDALLPELTVEEQDYLQTVYALLDVHDLFSMTAREVLGYVRASLRTRKELAYTAAVPEKLFIPYVLHPRVNNEYADGSRERFFCELKERVKDKSLLDAALEVNLWCCEQATYQSTDDRTIGPLGMCRRAFGRCGEESTLAVAVLRAVGIPARQVYSPRWAHCDDNHAWVEFWAEDGWHYMGACEPEAVADEGWFISAASRAMLVRALEPDTKMDCRVVNTLHRYADTVELTAVVTARGETPAGVSVDFQLINDSRLHTLYRCRTDAAGRAVFETGLGSLVVSAFVEGRLLEKFVDTREMTQIELRWEEGFDPLCEVREERWQMRPPVEKVPAPQPVSEIHQSCLLRCEELRGAKAAAFETEEDYQWLRKARGNRQELERFLALETFSAEEKEAVLSTLTDKDFVDVTSEALADALEAALPYRGGHKKLVWEKWILAPRVEHEMLLPVRRELKELLEGAGLQDGEAVLYWMAQNLRPLEEHGIMDRRGNAAAYVRNGVCPRSEWDIVAVQICRALGIPAFINTVNGRIMLVTPDRAYTPDLAGESVCLRLLNTGEPLMYREHFTLARWTGEEYQTLEHAPHELNEHWNIHLLPGAYRLTTNRRQIDGTASTRVHSFMLQENRTLEVTLEPDETADKLKQIPLPAYKLRDLQGQIVEKAEVESTLPQLLVFAQSGAEPTEHLLLELLELQESYRKGGWPVRILLRRAEEAENTTLQRVLQALPESVCFLYEDDDRYAVQKAMGIGDYRLPLAVAVDGEGCGVYACANYNIRSAHTLLRILKML